MLPGISTQVFLPHRLTPALLDALAATGAGTLELVSARWHLDSGDRTQVREVAGWFRDHSPGARLAAPRFFETEFSRHCGPSLDLLDHDRARRIAAMDEVKRALELGEQVPLTTCVLALGARETRWSEPTLDHALTVVEHLKAFAAPLGVRIELLTGDNDFATPDHLLEVLRVGHFETCCVCVDVAAATLLDAGLAGALEDLGTRLTSLHLSDRGTVSGERLWPASGIERSGRATRGTLDWNETYALLDTLSPHTAGVLVVSDTQAGSAEQVTRMAREVWSHRARLAEERAGLA